MIQQVAEKTGGSVRRVCAVWGEARSRFFRAAAPTPTQLDDARIGDLIESVFQRHRRRYGYHRVRILEANGASYRLKDAKKRLKAPVRPSA